LECGDLTHDGHLVIQRAMVEGKDGTKVVGDTKTCVVRRVPLDREVQAALAQYRRAQAARRLTLGAAYTDHGYLFTSDTGRPLDVTSSPNARFHAICEAAELPKNPPYNLRHTCASILHDRGVPVRQIQRWLGHKDVKTTLGYIEARPDAQALTAAEMTRALATS
jgi:integrase